VLGPAALGESDPYVLLPQVVSSTIAVAASANRAMLTTGHIK
jgi:hypothetical protein